MPPVLTVAIDSAFAAQRGPLTWALREALVALGYGWREVEVGEPSDVWYGAPLGHSRATVVIEARPWRTCVTTPSWFADVRVPVERDGATAVVRRDVIQDLFAVMTGAAETTWPHNRHGHLDVPPAFHQPLRAAVGSRLVLALGDALRAAGVPPGVPRWPRGATAAAALTHDVDYPEVVRTVEPFRVLWHQGAAGLPAAWGAFTGRLHHWHFDTWMDLERSMGVRSAFYFAVRQGSLLAYAFGRPDPFYDVRSPRLARVIRELAGGGWEVGLHASYDAWRTADAFVRERAALEAVAETKVEGLRHHYWHLGHTNPQRTLQAHADAGFAYDASLAHDRVMGFRNGVAWPFNPWNPESGTDVDTVQLPTAWMDEHSFLHWHGPPTSAAAVDELVETVVSVGGCLLMNVHEYMVDDRLHPGRFATARALVSRVAHDSGVWVATPKELASHWRTRRASLEAVSRGLALS